MKILLATFALILSINVSATHTLSYYVYYETEYVQGPWLRTNILDESDYRYLQAEMYEDLFGTVNVDLVEKLLSRLKDRKPDVYNWKYDLSFIGDTVVITSKSQIAKLSTIQNEITATLLFNNFKAVKYVLNGKTQIFDLSNLTLPYFDLVSGRVEEVIVVDTTVVVEQVLPPEIEEPIQKKRNPYKIWLIISIILNVGLFGTVILQKAKSK